jgi:hypothetical protein
MYLPQYDSQRTLRASGSADSPVQDQPYSISYEHKDAVPQMKQKNDENLDGNVSDHKFNPPRDGRLMRYWCFNHSRG